MSKKEDTYNLIHKVLIVIVLVCMVLSFTNLFAGWHSLFISIPCLVFSFTLIVSSHGMSKRAKQKMKIFGDLWDKQIVYHISLNEQDN